MNGFTKTIDKQTELIMQLKKQYDDLWAENSQLRKACEASAAWVNKIYPDDVFTGESGAIEIVALRELLANVLGNSAE